MLGGSSVSSQSSALARDQPLSGRSNRGASLPLLQIATAMPFWCGPTAPDQSIAAKWVNLVSFVVLPVMEFEWHEIKREANIAKHGVDFGRAILIWRGDVVDPATERHQGGEIRLAALGTIGDDDLVICVIYTLRQGVRRLISARRARRNERRYYQDHFGHGN